MFLTRLYIQPKCLHLFNKRSFFKKNTFICWTRLKTAKLLATAKQLIRKNSVCCLKNQATLFHRASMQIGLTPSPLFVFIHFFNDLSPLHDKRTLWMPPFKFAIWKTFSSNGGAIRFLNLNISVAKSVTFVYKFKQNYPCYVILQRLKCHSDKRFLRSFHVFCLFFYSLS